MKNKLLLEELKRFNKIIGYDPKNPMINEGTESESVNSIISKLKPDLPLNDSSDKIEAILLLQKTLVALGKLNKSYGIDGDGVDGDFGGDTKNALKNTINSTELSDDNVNQFEVVLEKNKSKITNVVSDYETFIEKFKEMGGVSVEYMTICTTGKGTKRLGSNHYYPDLSYVLKRKTCVSKEEMAESLDKTFPDLSIYSKSAILSVMIKEQGKGDKICGANYNYSGIQTDSGRWGELDEKISDMFCSKDPAGVRSFASFNSLEDGISFMKIAFDKKNWFVELLKDVSDDEVEQKTFDLEEISKKNADIWQTDWNLKLNDEDYEKFKKYGYNSNLKGKSFSDSRGIYNKNVEDFTDEEKKLHNNNSRNYRTPESIQKSLNSVSTFYKKSFDIFKKIRDNKEQIST
jgi:hypothetical protein